ncbi:hypothetical protein HK102_001603, partial [Quaeritorhiza haematococci]
MLPRYLTLAAGVVLLMLIFTTYLLINQNTQISRCMAQTRSASSCFELEELPTYTPSLSSHHNHDSSIRNVYVDLGATNGDSFRAFLNDSSARWRMEFPKPFDVEYDEFECFLFEANPVWKKALEGVKKEFTEKRRERPVKVTAFPGTVVHVRDGKVDMLIDTWTTEHDEWASTSPNPTRGTQQSGVITLPSVDIASWLLRNFAREDFVIVKMDLEGAEFEVLPHIFRSKAFRVVDVLLVEWHPQHSAF